MTGGVGLGKGDTKETLAWSDWAKLDQTLQRNTEKISTNINTEYKCLVSD